MTSSETPSVGPYALQAQVLERMVHGHPLQEVLDDLCRMVGEMVSESACSVMLADEKTGGLSFRSAPSLPEQARRDFSGLTPGRFAASCGTAYYTKQPAIVADTQVDPRWAEYREIAAQYGIRGCWSIPLLREDDVLGTFAISRQVPGNPTPEQLRLLDTAANLAGLALGRALDERRLADQKELLQILIESAGDPLFAKDLEGRYLLANRAEARDLGDNLGALIGRTDREIYGEDLAYQLRAQDLEVIEKGETCDYRVVFPQTRGARTYLIRKSPLRHASGEICGVVGIARDVSEIERAEQIIQNAHRAESLGVLAGGVAHDFNNLLTGILGHASLALEDTSPDSSLRPLLVEIEHGAQRAAELTDQMLAYAGRSQVHKQPVDLELLVEDVLALLASSLCRHTRIAVLRDDSPKTVHADATQLRQVVLNLVTNASEALDGGPGSVTLRLATRGSFVELEVQDEGVGMDEDTRARIFEPFFTTKPRGRGLGLSAAQGICSRHGGQIECASTLGLGTTFRVCLPRHDGPALARAEPSSRAPAAAAAGTGLVLLADDQVEVRQFARRVLEQHGLRVLEAEDGDQALALARGHASELDLLVLDVRMPGQGGDEVLAALLAEGVDLPTLLSSGYGETEVADSIRDRVGFLKKPYLPGQLIEAINTLIARPKELAPRVRVPGALGVSRGAQGLTPPQEA